MTKISREDLEAAFARVLGEGEATAKEAAAPTAVIAGAVALGVITIAYALGRRKGRRRSAVLEIRKI